ncbi:OpgC domain-containing protein [bacterium]|nr:OpgC domain-containing protein [bacterium]
MPPTPTTSSARREPLLDLWRGLALIDMTWVHLALYPIGMPATLALWIGTYTRFAAGTFVMISGIAVARVFGAALAGPPAAARQARRRLLRRALLLLTIDRAAALAFVLIEGARSPASYAPRAADLLPLLTFASPGVTGGLLALYAILLVATPLLDSLRRRLGSGALLALSAAVYAAGYAGSAGTTWPFPPLLWQAIFVTGYVLSDPLRRWFAAGPTPRFLVAVSSAFALVFAVRNGAALGLPLPAPPAGLAFVKVPLSPAELAWYLIASTFVLAWTAALWQRSPLVRERAEWLCQLGRKSLLVYTAHLFLEVPILELLTLLDPTPLARAAMLPLAAALLVAIAATGEWLDRRRGAGGRARAWPSLRLPSSGAVGSGVAIASLLAVLVMQQVIPPRPGGEVETTATYDDAVVPIEAVTGDDALPAFAEADGPPLPATPAVDDAISAAPLDAFDEDAGGAEI